VLPDAAQGARALAHAGRSTPASERGATQNTDPRPQTRQLVERGKLPPQRGGGRTTCKPSCRAPNPCVVDKCPAAGPLTLRPGMCTAQTRRTRRRPAGATGRASSAGRGCKGAAGSRALQARPRQSDEPARPVACTTLRGKAASAFEPHTRYQHCGLPFNTCARARARAAPSPPPHTHTQLAPRRAGTRAHLLWREPQLPHHGLPELIRGGLGVARLQVDADQLVHGA
jgi:hypothetical protein